MAHIHTYDMASEDAYKHDGKPVIVFFPNRSEWAAVAKCAAALIEVAKGDDLRFARNLLSQAESAAKSAIGIVDAVPVPAQYKKYADCGKEL